MRKKLILFLLCLNCNPHLFCQDFIRKDIIVTASIGFPHLNKVTVGLLTRSDAFQTSFNGRLEIGTIKGVNPIALKYEYAVTKHFGLGVSLSWWSILINVKDHYDTGTGPNIHHQTDIYDFKISSVSFGIRPNYHFALKSKKSDLFIGCALGIAKTNVTVNVSSTQANGIFAGSFAEFKLPSTLYFAPTLGYRIYFINNFGLNFEVGYEKGALLQAGIVFRFRPLSYEPLK